MSRPEARIEAEVSKYARENGMLQLKLNIRGNVGWPDKMFLYRGEAFFIEFKAPGEVPRKLQIHVHDQLVEQGFFAYFCDDVTAGKAIIDYHLEDCEDDH